MDQNKKPTVGLTVLYVPQKNSPEAYNEAEVVPAIITRVWSNSCVNLKVLNDAPFDTWKTSVILESGKRPGTWHWPEINVVTSSETLTDENAAGETEDGEGGNHPPKPGNP